MRSTLVVVAVLATGCGDNIPTVAFENVAAERQAAECERLTRCGLFSDTGTCVAYFRPAFEPDVRAAVRVGRVHYDPVSAFACNVALAAMSCDQSAADVRETLATCGRVLTGVLPPDAECAFDLECASSECDAPPCGADTCCYGTCQPTVVAAVDEPCEIDRHCVGPAFCNTDGVCQPLASAGGACAIDTHCEPGLACVGATDLQPGACRVLPLIGESCPYLRCAEIGATCNDSQICVAVGATGATCATDAECSEFRSCDPMTLRCVDTPRVGMPCRERCAGEAYCARDGSPIGVCAPPQENGAPCLSFNECASRFCAEGETFDACGDRAVCF